jgi:uncharacterized membrane protein
MSKATQEVARSYFGPENLALDAFQKAEVPQLRQLLNWQNQYTILASYDPQDPEFARILAQNTTANICSVKRRKFLFFTLFFIFILLSLINLTRLEHDDPTFSSAR